MQPTETLLELTDRVLAEYSDDYDQDETPDTTQQDADQAALPWWNR